ncbi:hypothetical protein SAMN05216487_4646 [Pseudomonas sp. UC 17F4]|uniref:hypothetical protein n=1 Tax=Pseudomonas sp. UC 17F4 TaxID=1855328 RepID=UPI0008862307|nr:hypothetical protein [Pseudomonas sp. UC 17F4]SDQ91858.1 hypothetical protein SAMN05216487_4646 [Pseudomonas sp. UC 17F4]
MDTTQSPDATQPSDAPFPFDATLLFKALQYQLLVAVEHCYDLKPDESLWLEVFGDVTVPGNSQTEVKLYSDNLTDSHSNFWNTLKNWLHEKFVRTSYKRLVLLTTQEFGPQSKLKGWNKRTPEERLAIMEKIFNANHGKAAKKAAKEAEAGDDPSEPSKSQSLQHYVMDPRRRQALMEILERMVITTGADSLEQRIEKYQNRHLKPIRPSKYQQFIDDLLGFISSTKLVNEGWQITHKAFTDKVSELSSLYMKHPKTFPPVDIAGLKKNIDINEIRPMPFAQKIIEIGAESELKLAALHRVVAQTTISELYTDGVLFKPAVDLYFSNELTMHKYGRKAAMLDCIGVTCTTKLKTDSQKFYFQRNGVTVEPFCGLQNTMPEFRNGVYHLLAEETPEDEDDEFHWRLWL